MDTWARMFQEEADTLAFLLQEEMEDIMNEIQSMQNEARNAYEAYYARDLVSDEPVKFSALQAAMLAEIALQLAKQNEHLESIAKNLDSFRINGLPVENIH